MYAKKHMVDDGRRGAHDSTEESERANAAGECIEESAGGNCANTKCEAFGSGKICTQCKSTFVPINGQCVAADTTETKAKCMNAGGTDKADQTCGKCLGATFMYKGGCYDKEGDLGRVICKTPGTTLGVCQDCQAGYFKNPANVETSDSCIACGDATGVTVSGGATYKGVANCAAQHCSSKGREW